MIVPFYGLVEASFFPWTRDIFFLVGSSTLLSMTVQQLVVILVVSQEMSAHPSTL